MELIIDPACSVAFEMEPEERDVMQRPPRNPRARLFTRILVVRSLLQGIGALAAAALVFGVSMRSGLIETDVRMLTFTTLIVTNLLLIVTNRSLTRPTLADWWTPNPALRWLGAGALAILALILYVPFIRDLFRMSRPHADDALVIAAAGVGALVWMELVKRYSPSTQGDRS